MHKIKEIVINTGPIIALVAAIGDLNILKHIYKNVYIPYEVQKEMLFQSSNKFAVNEFKKVSFLVKENKPLKISPFLANTLDSGEASVIQLALNKKAPKPIKTEIVYNFLLYQAIALFMYLYTY